MSAIQPNTFTFTTAPLLWICKNQMKFHANLYMTITVSICENVMFQSFLSVSYSVSLFLSNNGDPKICCPITDSEKGLLAQKLIFNYITFTIWTVPLLICLMNKFLMRTTLQDKSDDLPCTLFHKHRWDHCHLCNLCESRCVKDLPKSEMRWI